MGCCGHFSERPNRTGHGLACWYMVGWLIFAGVLGVLPFGGGHSDLAPLFLQQMLDHGTLTQEDIDIQTHGASLPNLGPNFHTPKALLDTVNYYLPYNMLSSVGDDLLHA